MTDVAFSQVMRLKVERKSFMSVVSLLWFHSMLSTYDQVISL